MQATLSTLGSNLGIRAGISAWHVLAASPERIAQLRKDPGPTPGEKISPSTLRAADDQTVVGLAAVLQAMRDLPEPHDFTSWGVLAAPVHFGRAVNHAALQRFREEGAWGISPHLIPQHSLHALSGTISQLLHMRGPNFGVGNSPSAAEEAFLIAATMLTEQTIAGLWLVLTGHAREYLPTCPAPDCVAVALALESGAAGHARLHLSLNPSHSDESDSVTLLAPLTLAGLADVLAEATPWGAWSLGERCSLRIDVGQGEQP